MDTIEVTENDNSLSINRTPYNSSSTTTHNYIKKGSDDEIDPEITAIFTNPFYLGNNPSYTTNFRPINSQCGSNLSSKSSRASSECDGSHNNPNYIRKFTDSSDSEDQKNKDSELQRYFDLMTITRPENPTFVQLDNDQPDAAATITKKRKSQETTNQPLPMEATLTSRSPSPSPKKPKTSLNPELF